MKQRLAFAWAGQLVSALLTATTAFAISIWVYETTGRALASSSLLLARFLPPLILSPLAGIVVDRMKKKSLLVLVEWVLVGLNVPLAVFFVSGKQDLWLLLVLLAVIGGVHSIRQLIYQASIGKWVKQENLSRANGVVALLEAIPYVLAPFAGALFLRYTSLSWIVMTNMLSYCFAIGMLYAVKSQEEAPMTAPTAKLDFLRGFSWIFSHSRLRALMWLFSWSNFFNGVGLSLLIPYACCRANNHREVLALIMGAGSIGAVLGSGLMTVLKEVKHKELGIYLMLLCCALFGRIGFVSGGFVMGPLAWIAAYMVRQTLTPMANAWNQSIWQSECPKEQQGQIFGARRFLGQGAYPIGLFLGGLVADRWAEPMFAQPGLGIATIFVLAGVGEILSSSLAFLSLTRARAQESWPTSPRVLKAKDSAPSSS